jgi:hypothetical protein
MLHSIRHQTRHHPTQITAAITATAIHPDDEEVLLPLFDPFEQRPLHLHVIEHFIPDLKQIQRKSEQIGLTVSPRTPHLHRRRFLKTETTKVRIRCPSFIFGFAPSIDMFTVSVAIEQIERIERDRDRAYRARVEDDLIGPCTRRRND